MENMMTGRTQSICTRMPFAFPKMKKVAVIIIRAEEGCCFFTLFMKTYKDEKQPHERMKNLRDDPFFLTFWTRSNLPLRGKHCHPRLHDSFRINGMIISFHGVSHTSSRSSIYRAVAVFVF